MENEFIPYEQALALAKLNFNEKCFGYYGLENELYIEISCNLDSNLTRRNFIATPTYQQAFRWFREKYSIFPNISYEGKFMNTFEILNEKGDDYNSGERFSYHDTYEEAELVCLNKLIEITKTK
jgi:hypothetical protein